MQYLLPSFQYEYDGLGHRVMKKIKWSSGTHDTLTYYIYDPQGVMLATYNKVVQTGGGSYKHIKLQEQEIYGTDRLGFVIMDSVMYKSTVTFPQDSTIMNYDSQILKQDLYKLF
jgi:hypothetical protein